MRSTLFWLAVSLAITIAVTFLLWTIFEFYAFFGLLLLPFLFSLRRRRARGVNVCPRCGHVTRDPRDVYCPRDATLLETHNE